MKVAIIGGAGGVGSSIAFNLLLRGGPYEVALIDINRNMIASHVMDLEQTLALSSASSVRSGDEAEALNADVVIVSASAPLRLNSSRLVFLNENATIVNRIVEILIAAGSDWGGILLMVTNPVDQLCTWVQRRTGFDRRRILGYTLNDSLRLRTGVGQALGAAPQDIDAWVVGEHGDFCVPLFSRVKLSGAPVELTAEQRNRVEEFIRSWYARHVALNSSRSTTWTTGLGVARMVEAMAIRGNDLWPASVVLAGEYGIDGVSLSVPVSLSRSGAEDIHEWNLTSEERVALQAAATHVREATNAINLAVERKERDRQTV